ncbi:MAG: CocE/NonD family hydrolase [Thermoleophilaceae bacterium]|nr:CocE/NonD family hydrolase [Thermoleophilaceae bacterium]
MRGVRVLAGVLSALALVLATAAGAQAYTARGSVEQVYVTGATPGAQLVLEDSAGGTVGTRTVNPLGATLFRNVPPAAGYRVRPAAGGGASPPVRVLSTRSAPPDTSVYGQSIPQDGYGYLTTRDGTQLAINVHPPQDVADVIPLPPGIPLPPVPTGPTPTLIEYSGYGYANPDGPTNGIAILANLMGFTVVDVNMRGTGCSGGAYDFFEPLQSLDGYDVIETIARQPWVANGKVGMMGISYGGISQLFTAATQPPSLAAISPLSVIDSTQTTLYPGGILNTGFAVAWAQERINEARPASSTEGQAWAYQRIQEGDQTCAANQALHPEAVDLMAKIRANDSYVPEVADPLAPETFVKKVKVPTFLACQWQDEQTGGHCPTLAKAFTGTDRKWFNFTNGTHVDSLAPETFNRWYDFLKLYVARQAPITDSALIKAAAPVVYEEAMGVSGVTMPRDPIQEQPTYAGALAAFEALPAVRVLFDNGAGGLEPGQPLPGFERSWARWPIPGTTARSWYLSGNGKLKTKGPPEEPVFDKFTWDARARPLTNFTGDTGSGENGLWTATPPYGWSQNPPGKALSYITHPLKSSKTVIGGGAVRVWVKTPSPNVDLQATLSEVRPDGKETFVQGGWVRADKRKLDAAKSTTLAPVLSLRASDVQPLQPTGWYDVVIPLYYQGHAYRAGSSIRLTIAAPNGDQPIWSFNEADPAGTTEVQLALTKLTPSQLILPVVPGVSVPTGLPPCPALRGQPCRDYQAFSNR